MLSGLPFFQLWLGTPPMKWSSFLLWAHPQNHCTSEGYGSLPFQALELMHLLNYVHTLVWFINVYVRNKIEALKFVNYCTKWMLFGFANCVKKESVSLHLLWRCSLWWCSPSVNYGDNCDDGFHELSRRSCFDLFVPCAFHESLKAMKGNEALAWACSLFAKVNDAGQTEGFLVLLPMRRCWVAIELGEIFLPCFLKGVTACAFLELLFWVCFV